VVEVNTSPLLQALEKEKAKSTSTFWGAKS
jgi:hypothetical protein